MHLFIFKIRFKAITNLMLKRESLTIENRRLLEKNKKINTIIESLIVQGADMSEINDVKAMISSDELNLLNSVTEHCNK